MRKHVNQRYEGIADDGRTFDSKSTSALTIAEI